MSHVGIARKQLCLLNSKDKKKKKGICVNVNEVTPQFSVLEEEKAVKMSFVLSFGKWICVFNLIHYA